MMSSEDEGGTEGPKRRVRQRVDAGEPRNSYASIPNFSSRPYNGFTATKMLCDLLQHQKAENGGFDFGNSPESSDSTHLLRDILQRGGVGAGALPPSGLHAPPTPSPVEEEEDDDEKDSDQHTNSDSESRSMSAAPELSSQHCPPDSPSGAVAITSNGEDLQQSKRARVETIVRNMLPRPNGHVPSGSLQVQAVNGCKKRKLYQPQQTSRPNGDLKADPDGGATAFREQLKNLQRQLNAMQQHYDTLIVDGDSTDDEGQPPKSPGVQSDNEDLKPLRNNYVDYDNASMYDEQKRLVIDDAKEPCRRPKSQGSPNLMDYEWLAESLKAELSTSLSQVVDKVLSKCVQRKSSNTKVAPQSPPPAPKDPTLLSQMLDRKSPRTSAKHVGRVNGFSADSTGAPPPSLPKPSFFFPLKPQNSVAATAAFLYGSPPLPYGSSTPQHDSSPEQTEAMSLVVGNKKKRHKVTDSRLAQRGLRPSDSPQGPTQPYQGLELYPPPPLVPVSLPTTVAIPNPSLHQSELFHSFFPEPPTHRHYVTPEDSPLALSYQHHRVGTPDSMHHLSGTSHHHHLKDGSDIMSDNGGDSPITTYDNSGLPMISFLPSLHTSTLTPMHLRKAKLMFFYARYPSSAVLKMYFPDIKFNKNNTAQLVKWFSNFREFFYIQMEKYARQAISENIKSSDELKVGPDSELLRVLNLHYNRNNHIEAPDNFRYVVENTLREFYKALVAGKDSEQSWKKSIYKIIARLDDNVPEYFKSPNFLDTLE